MRTLRPQRPSRRLVASTAVATLVATVGLGAALAAPASANPNADGSTGCLSSSMSGAVYLTGATTVAKGQKVYFAGEDFAVGGNATTPARQVLSAKLDAFSSTQTYSGVGNDAAGLVGTFQTQHDGSFSGFVVVPSDIDDPTVNGTAAGPHFLRFLGSDPAVSCWSEDFAVSGTAAAAPSVTASVATASSRGSVTVRITASGTGFTPGDTVTVTRALHDGTLGTLTADASGAVSGTLSVAVGTLPAGQWQLLFSPSNPSAVPGVAQVEVQPVATFANLSLGGDGTLTVTNASPGAIFSSVRLARDGAAPVEVLTSPVTADATGAATGTVRVPDAVANLGTHDLVVTQTYPYAATYTVSSKVSPSSATFGTDGYTVISTPDGAIEQGLYQSAYSAASDALFVTSANVTTTSRIYKLDPATLAVKASVQPAYVSGDSGALWAAYGVGVDDTHGTVWVTNTRQNTVAVYAQSDLHLLKQWAPSSASDPGYVSHSRDVVVDAEHGHVFVSSASEGSTGDGYISVFEADDLDGDGVKYEWIKNIATYPRTTFSPVSLELDAAHDVLFSPSLTTQSAIVIDTVTLEDTLLSLPDLTAGGRGASGIAFDAVTNRLFIASQNSDELMISQLNADRTTGTTVKEVATGAGALNVAFDPVKRLAYVANLSGTTVSVVDVNGNQVANLPIARPNHVAEDGKGSVFVVNKDTGNRVFKITPKATTTTPVVTAVKAGTVTVSGKAKVGTTLTTKAAGWQSGATLAYSWKRGTKVVSTKATYQPVAADLGVTLTVTVTGTAKGYTATAKTVSTAKVAKGTLKAAKPKVSGTAKAGKKLTAKPGSWTKGAKLTYQWRVGGKAVKGAKKKTFKVKAAYRGKKVTVKVTGTLKGYAKVAKTSAAKKIKKR